MIKKLLIGFVGFAVIVVVALALIPMFVDGNKIKVKIQEAVKENLNADIEIGNIKLSLWGGIDFRIDKLILSEQGSQGKKPVFNMKDAELVLPYSSIFGGRPDITLRVAKPEIRIVKSASGKLNVMDLVKPSKSEAKSNESSQKPGAAAALVFDFSVDLSEGHLSYIDDLRKSKTELSGMNLKVDKLGINQNFKFKFSTQLKSQEMKDLKVQGPLNLEGLAGVYIKAEGLDKIILQAELDMKDLAVIYSTLFAKNAGVPLKIKLDLVANETNLNFKEAKFIANDAVLELKGTVSDYATPVVNFEIASNKLEFEHWQKIIKPLAEFDMKGLAQLGVHLHGPVSGLSYGGKMTLDKGSMRAPGIVPRITDISATLDFNADGVSLPQSSLKMGKNDLSFHGGIKNFQKPVINLVMESKLFDLDSLLPQKTPEQLKQEEKVQQTESNEMSEAQMAAMVAGPIILMKRNPMMRDMDFTAKVNMKKLVVHKAPIENLQAEMNFKNLSMELRKAVLQTFGGAVGMNALIDFKGNEPKYKASGEVKGLDINAAITNQMPMAKDTLFGKTMGKFSIEGAGVTKTRAKQTLTGSAHMEIQNGSWSSLTAMKTLSEKVSSIPVQSIKDQLGKINITDKFRQLKTDIKIAGGRFNIVSMIADMEGTNTTINGTGWIDFDMNNSIAGQIFTPVGGEIPPKNRAADGRMRIPYEIGCKINSPCLNLSQATKEIGEGLLKEQGAKAIKKAVEKIDNPQVQELLKKLPF